MGRGKKKKCSTLTCITQGLKRLYYCKAADDEPRNCAPERCIPLYLPSLPPPPTSPSLSFHPLFHSRFIDKIAFSLGSASLPAGRYERAQTQAQLDKSIVSKRPKISNLFVKRLSIFLRISTVYLILSGYEKCSTPWNILLTFTCARGFVFRTNCRGRIIRMRRMNDGSNDVLLTGQNSFSMKQNNCFGVTIR